MYRHPPPRQKRTHSFIVCIFKGVLSLARKGESMNAGKKTVLATAVLLLVSAVFTTGAYAHSSVTLLDVDSNVVAGTTKAYSPKRTCGTTGCHIDGLDQQLRYGITNNIYEDTNAFAVKDHGPGYPSYGNGYEVPYAQHGVSAGYHFQQGRNIAWSNPQRSFYSLPGFTSSPGMFGKF